RPPRPVADRPQPPAVAGSLARGPRADGRGGRELGRPPGRAEDPVRGRGGAEPAGGGPGGVAGGVRELPEHVVADGAVPPLPAARSPGAADGGVARDAARCGRRASYVIVTVVSPLAAITAGPNSSLAPLGRTSGVARTSDTASGNSTSTRTLRAASPPVFFTR